MRERLKVLDTKQCKKVLVDDTGRKIGFDWIEQYGLDYFTG